MISLGQLCVWASYSSKSSSLLCDFCGDDPVVHFTSHLLLCYNHHTTFFIICQGVRENFKVPVGWSLRDEVTIDWTGRMGRVTTTESEVTNSWTSRMGGERTERSYKIQFHLHVKDNARR